MATQGHLFHTRLNTWHAAMIKIVKSLHSANTKWGTHKQHAWLVVYLLLPFVTSDKIQKLIWAAAPPIKLPQQPTWAPLTDGLEKGKRKSKYRFWQKQFLKLEGPDIFRRPRVCVLSAMQADLWILELYTRSEILNINKTLIFYTQMWLRVHLSC